MNILFDINCPINSIDPQIAILNNLLQTDYFGEDKIFVLCPREYISLKINSFSNGNIVYFQRYEPNFHSLSSFFHNKKYLFVFTRLIGNLFKCKEYLKNFYLKKVYKKIATTTHFNSLIKITPYNDGFDALCFVAKKMNIHVSIVLVDPISNFNHLPDIKKTLRINRCEYKLIKLCQAYFCYQSFYDIYKSTYQSCKIIKYFFPLLLPKTLFVSSKRFNCYSVNSFAYFGSINSYRSIDLLVSYFLKRPKYFLHVYSNKIIPNLPQNIIFHEPVPSSEIGSEILKYNFLVGIDNSFDKANLLPSKYILYVSSTKPIIIFSGQKNNISDNFFKEYDLFFHCYSISDFHSLDHFVKNNLHIEFRNSVYTKFLEFSPDKFAKDLKSKI